MYKFDVKDATDKCVAWVKEWFEGTFAGCNAIVGISGGKDSTVAAAICVQAIGKERVLGVLMPMGVQHDIDYSHEICEYLDIRNITVNIAEAVNGVYNAIGDSIEISSQTRFNLPPRIRMSTLYAVAQSMNGRVINTCNLSEDWVGYSTRYGDSVGDLSPLSYFTVTEVKAIGKYLGVPDKFIVKPPIDGLCGRTDEDNLGFTYDTLDKYIRENIEPEKSIKDKIDNMHMKNKFKLELMPAFKY